MERRGETDTRRTETREGQMRGTYTRERERPRQEGKTDERSRDIWETGERDRYSERLRDEREGVQARHRAARCPHLAGWLGDQH